MKAKPLSGDAQKADSFENYTIERAQDRQHDIMTTAIGKGDLVDGEFKIDSTTSPKRVYTKIDGELYYFTLTAS